MPGGTITSLATVGAGTGSFDANFPHTSGQVGVSVSARLTEFPNGLGTLYAAVVVGDLTISDPPPIEVDRGAGFGTGYLSYVDAPPLAPKSTLRLTAADRVDLVLTGKYDKTKGTAVSVVIFGGKKKRPHAIYTSRDADVVLNAAAQTYTSLPETVFLRSSDCVHLVTALHHNLPEIYTYDTHQTLAAPSLGLRPVTA